MQTQEQTEQKTKSIVLEVQNVRHVINLNPQPEAKKENERHGQMDQ